MKFGRKSFFWGVAVVCGALILCGAIPPEGGVGPVGEGVEVEKKEAKEDGVSDVTQRVRAALERGRDWMAKGQWESAKLEFKRVLELDAGEPGALLSLGWIAQKQGAWAESEEHLRNALKRSLGDGNVWMALGVSLLEQEKTDAAAAAFHQCAVLDPKNARYRRLLGIALGRKGWLDGAEQEIRRSLELEPEDAGAHFNLAAVYLQRKPPTVELARRHYFKARDLGLPPDPEMEAQFSKLKR